MHQKITHATTTTQFLSLFLYPAPSRHVDKTSSLGYFEHKNDYWTQQCAQSLCCTGNISSPLLNGTITTPIVDLWDTHGPAFHLNGTDYEEFIFLQCLLEIIDNHNTDDINNDDPLFLFYAPHIAHCPLQVPKEYLDQFDFITTNDDEDQCRVETSNVFPKNEKQPARISCRKQYRAMVHLLDDMIGKVVDRLRKKRDDMWDNLLIVFTSDNGGPLRLTESGATNYPLRGGKYSLWEGGVRAAAFVSGGYLPASRRGVKLMEPIHIADWYRTLAALAGNEHVEDELARQSGLPTIDSVNVAPLLLGHVTRLHESKYLFHRMLSLWVTTSSFGKRVSIGPGGQDHSTRISTAQGLTFKTRRSTAKTAVSLTLFAILENVWIWHCMTRFD